MTSSVSRQVEPNLVLWLATRAGKMELSCLLGIQALSRKYNLSCFGVLSHIINPFIDQACSVKMAGYWPHSFFAGLWTSTLSRSINTQKKSLTNIQPSWPHAWSITHTSYLLSPSGRRWRMVCSWCGPSGCWSRRPIWWWREGEQHLWHKSEARKGKSQAGRSYCKLLNVLYMYDPRFICACPCGNVLLVSLNNKPWRPSLLLTTCIMIIM